ncbi:MAG: hypothetical protein K2N48_12225 [Muribaculaceae bacterium]|nr:hypothetical protein [Muribaculaceae bacterium]
MLNITRKEAKIMLMDPAKIGFENVCDIVDYTARGCIPSKDDFRAVMAKVRQPDVGIRVDVKAPYIPSDIVPTSPESRELLAQVLERVDEDRRKNRRDRNIATAVLAVAGVGVGLLIGGHHHHDEAKVAE